MTILGWYPLLRLQFDSSLFAVPNYPIQIPAVAYAMVVDGVIQSIIMTNNGAGYLAPPKINIVGNGSGAVCEAVWNPADGSISAINVIHGGSGYWRIPNAVIANGVAPPVDPQNQGATVVITTGYIENLLYR